MSAPRVARCWCFTINNYVETELELLRESLSGPQVRFACFGYEVSGSGTPHLQGFVSFKIAKRFNAVKALVGERAHIEASRGSEEQNVQYCKKEGGQFEEFGDRSQQGKNKPLEGLIETVKSGVFDKKVLREMYPTVCARYDRFVDQVISDHRPVPPTASHVLRPWQSALTEALSVPPDDRCVLFVIGEQGNEGKTWFALQYCDLHKTAKIMEPGKKADLAFDVPVDVRVLFMDCTRTQNETLNYSFLESMKNGYILSPKYFSHVKRFGKVHVVVLTNSRPNLTALSADRYSIWLLDTEGGFRNYRVNPMSHEMEPVV